MEIRIKDDQAEVYTPYNGCFVQKMKDVSGAKWNPIQGCWTVPSEFVPEVREIMESVYGYHDLMKNETVKLRVTFKEDVTVYRKDIVLFGKVIAHARGRDSGAKVGDDVALTLGKIYSAGSVKNWTTNIDKGSVFSLTNVNTTIYESECRNNNLDHIEIEELEEDVPDKEELLKEIEVLTKQLAELKQQLQKCHG